MDGFTKGILIFACVAFVSGVGGCTVQEVSKQKAQSQIGQACVSNGGSWQQSGYAGGSCMRDIEAAKAALRELL